MPRRNGTASTDKDVSMRRKMLRSGDVNVEIVRTLEWSEAWDGAQLSRTKQRSLPGPFYPGDL